MHSDIIKMASTSTNSKKILIPKVWKRPHSTIYGKNVEYGNSLYSDKIGEIDSRKFNTELPWSVRNANQTGYLPSISNQQDNNTTITTSTTNNTRTTLSNNNHNEPLITRQRFDNLTDFDTELGLFVPARRTNNTPDIIYRSSFNASLSDNDNWSSSSANRRQSLGSINPQSYRPNLPNKASTLTDSEEFEYQDKSSPFYTDR